MTNEELMKLINAGLRIDGVNITAFSVLAEAPKENLVQVIAYLLGKIE